ncbi:MAG TPA: heme-binding beta-barrel domain-containing protein [Acidimicrobiia bacterium]|nr:heme-binding beta-barrel domain-containing protein [Acidimicrobiia bacterium]
MGANSEWGPLAGLIGEWEGDQGLDVSFHNVEGELGETKYLEKVSMKPFGPVDNGSQHLYGLDYRMAAWRNDEENPFHTEVGYWLWDGATKQVMRCFMVPRGSTVLAGGTAEPDATTFRMEATNGDTTYGILENKYLAEKAHTTRYVCTVNITGDSWNYDELTSYQHAIGGDIAHSDRNTLRRVS